jgi:hypothetical protein
MFYVYHNDTLAIEGFALVVPHDWGYFSFHSTIGSSIDNITVTEFVEEPTTPTDPESTTPEPSTTPTGTGEPLDTTMILIIAGGGVAVVVIVAIVVKMRS